MLYQTLIDDLKTRLETIDRYDTDVTAGWAMLKTVWTIGKEVHDYSRESGVPAKDIARDAGAAPGTLDKYVRFYKQYRQGYKEEIGGRPLNWSHYAAVLYVGDPHVREFYLKNAALHNWSSHELRRRIQHNFYENHQLASVERAPKGAGQLKTIDQRLYTYAAGVLKVVDADTLLLEIDVGFLTRMEHKVRLRGINAPEKGTQKGDKAKAFVEQELSGLDGNFAPVIIRSYKTSEKFGRYLVDLWYLKGETDKERILAEGQLLNRVLLDRKLAVMVE